MGSTVVKLRYESFRKGEEVDKTIIVIEDFSEWNDWFLNKKVEISRLNSEEEFHQNRGVVLKGDGAKEHGIVKGDYVVRIDAYHAISGISAKNTEQTIAIELLRDRAIPLVVLSGVAGSGKTLIACAYALERLTDSQDNIEKVVIAKSMTPVGREVGFLKGGIEEKVIPWLGPFYDNFIQCGYDKYFIEGMMNKGQLEITPITFIQGRSISNAIIIIDEVQNLDIATIKQIITRAAEGSKIILLGDQSQVFERFNKDESLLYLLEKGKISPLVGTIHLQKSLRSPIADWAVLNL